jgi:hypothetical protein
MKSTTNLRRGRKSATATRRQKHFSQRGFEPLEDRLVLSMVLGPDKRIVRFEDASGDDTVIKLLGPGSAQITLAGDARNHADLDTILLTGTSQASKLLIATDDGDTAVRGFINIGPGGLGKLDVRGTLSASVRSQGAIDRIHASAIEHALISSPRIQTVSVDGRVLRSTIVAGLDTENGVLCDGNDRLRPGTVARINIRGGLVASSIAAGLAPGQDCEFGTSDDLVEHSNELSSIGSIHVSGRISDGGTSLHYAIAAADAAPQVFRRGHRFMGLGAVQVIGPVTPSSGDTTPPVIAATLWHDSGPAGGVNDGNSSDATVVGTLADSSSIASFVAGFTDTPTLSVIGDLEPDGTFRLDPSRLAQINGGALPDGPYRLRLQASDAHGNTSSVFALSFVLDTTAPLTPAFDLASSSDTLPLGDHQTEQASVTLAGTTAAAMALELLAGQAVIATGTSGGAGTFRFDNVALPLGDQSFTVRATDLAGNATEFSRTISRVSPAVAVDPVLEWNRVAIEAIRSDASPPPLASRSLAMVHAAIYDVVNALDGDPGFYVTGTAPAGTSVVAAVAAAADRVLMYIYPGQQSSLDAAFAGSLSRVVDGTAESDGIALGRSVADSIIAMRSTDGWDDFTTFFGGEQPGQWRPTEPMFDVALLPQWATLDPFTMTAPSQFRPPGPPSLDSQAYATAMNEVKSLGAQSGGSRTSEQTAIARFWADGAGTYTPPGHWNLIAEEVAASRGMSISDNARLFAALNLSLADAAITAWDVKYADGFWRPNTAIHQADLDGNSATAADGDWESFLITPPFPEYVSGHSTFSAAAATILAATFGDATTFTTRSIGLPGVDRTFPSFTAAAAEAGRSRIYGGIHFEFSNQDGQAAGRQVADWVLDAFHATTDTKAPTIIVESPTRGQTVREGFTVTGRVLDNLSGTASLVSALDGGPFGTVPLQSGGRFSIPVTLPADGTADGTHILRLVATDAAGNVAAPVLFAFTLDTIAPTIAVTSPSQGALIAAGDHVTGTVGGTGSALTALSYAFDGGAPLPIPFDQATGVFDGALVLARLTAGAHTLSIMAQDAAGNRAITSLDVQFPVAVPFAITSQTPQIGAADVGVTFRPQVFFSRPVQPDSINDANFFATGPDGQKLPAKIVPARDGSLAWLFFARPMPGGATITLHIDGDTILAAGDGTKLDGDGDGAPGGSNTTSFTTVSLAPLLGTTLSGRVVDAGADLKPMTFDDIRPGPDGTLHTADDVFLNPILGARVFILGLEDQAVLTDAQGRFHFDSVPAGDVKVAVDGNTATGAPGGYFWPEMVIDATFQPGRSNTLMGSMGSLEERQANADRPEVYLPRLRTDILHAAGGSTPVTIGLDPKSAINLSPEQTAGYSITVAPNSLVDANGNPMPTGQVGFSTVSPDLVRDMLPPGVAQLSTTLTIQAPGVAAFTTPLDVSFANIYGGAPGSQLEVYSFNHTTGLLEITGTATVSADGLTARTDPGQGITHPGWFGVTPPGSPNSPPCDPTIVPKTIHSPVPLLVGIQDRFALKDTDGFLLAFANNAAPIDPGLDVCHPINAAATPLVVTINVEGPATSFLDGGLVSQEFYLFPKQHRSIQVEMKDLLGNLKNYESDVLFGATVTVQGRRYGDKNTKLFDEKFYVYRYLDATDAPHVSEALFPPFSPTPGSANLNTDGVLEMPDTVADGSGAIATVSHYRTIQIRTGAERPTFQVSGVDYSFASDSVVFDPVSVGKNLPGKIDIVSPNHRVAGTLTALGNGVQQKWYIDTVAFNQKLATLVQMEGSDIGIFDPDIVDNLSDAEYALIDTPEERAAIVNGIVVRADVLLSGFAPGVQRITTPDADAVLFNNFETPYGTDPATYGRASGVDNEANGGIEYLIASLPNYSKAAQNNLLSAVLNEHPDGSVAIYIDHYFRGEIFVSANEIINAFGKTVAHEFGHSSGLNHTSGKRIISVPGAGSDMMAQGADQAGTRRFTITTNALKVALGLDWSSTEAQQAISYFGAYLAAGGAFDGQPESPPDSTIQPVSWNGPIAWILAGDDETFVTGSLDLGSVLADGPGGQVVTRNLRIANLGNEPLLISDLSILNRPDGMTITPIVPGTEVVPGNALPISITFDPTSSGVVSGELSLTSNALSGRYSVIVNASPVSPHGDMRVSIQNNNLGGQAVDAGTLISNGAATIQNIGASPLTVREIRIATGQGQGQFGLGGLPISLGPANPLVIDPGSSFTFDLSFDPDMTGLRRGVIEIASDDPETPIVRQAVLGTGLANGSTSLDYGNDFVAMETHLLRGAPVLRQISDDAGNWSFFLPPNQAIHYSIFDPISGLIAHAYDVTAASGRNTPILAPVFLASTANDSDGDGLPDDIEFAIGTGLNDTDTDDDGVSDFAEIAQGLDPLGGRGLPIGVVAGATLRGEAHELVIEGSTSDPTTQTAYVATGNYGLAIVDVSTPTQPIVLSEINLPGLNNDVGVDVTRNLALVAAGSEGVHLVDVSNPMLPTLIKTVSVGGAATRVELFDGLAYVAAGKTVVSIDLVTHEVRQTLQVGQRELTGLAIEANTLYTLDDGATVRAITLNGLEMDLRGALALPTLPDERGAQIFVGNGVAYIPLVSTNTTSNLTGFFTVDVRDPANLTQISGIYVTSPGIDFAATGSGLGLLIGDAPNPQNFTARLNALDVMLVADPENPGVSVTRIFLPGVPRGVAVASGWSFIADDASGLQVVNFQSLDTQGQPPTLSIATPGADEDPATPGIQVRAGRTVQVLADVADDVLVRNVELLVNNQVVEDDVSFPWGLVAAAPIVSQPITLTIQARASDTGGNSTLSNLLSIDVIPDNSAPTLIDTTPDDGQQLLGLSAIDLVFGEALDPALLNVSSVSLTNFGADDQLGGGDDTAIAIGQLVLRGNGRILTIVPATELVGAVHRLLVDPAILADPAGNHVTAPVVLDFSLRPLRFNIRAASGTPALLQVPSANPGQEISFVMPWGPEAARIQFPSILITGQRSSDHLQPSRVDPLTRTAYFVIPDNAITGDVTLYGGVTFQVSDLPNWTVVDGGVDVAGRDIMDSRYSRDPFPGNGLYLNLTDALGSASGTPNARLESKTAFDLTPGDYELSFDLAGGSFIALGTETVSLGGLFSETFTRPSLSPFATFSRTITVTDSVAARLVFGTHSGLYLDNVRLSRVDSGAVLLDDHFDLPFPDGTFRFQIVPVVTDVDVTSVTLDGSNATVELNGAGFIEGENTTYKFGSVAVVDSAANSGPDVLGDSFGDSRPNGLATLTLPLSPSAFGPISVTTAGGTSAPFSVGVSAITGTASSGTPTDPAESSANPGQSITIIGSGLTSSTDIVVQYTDSGGVPKNLLINPTLADLDGGSAQVILPAILNGVTPLRVFGSPASPSVQIVPVVQQGDVITPISPPSPFTRLVGRGFFEGTSTYDIGGTQVVDNSAILGPDVTGNNSVVDLTLVAGINDPVTVTTPGGTSAAMLANAPNPGELLAPVINGITAVAADGISANSSADSANTGQVITIEGANFRLSDLQVLFSTRDENGVDGVAGVAPLAVNGAGTLAQVRVPDLAATGPVRVTAVGGRNLGFATTNDAIHRGITTTFTPGRSTAVLRFSDGGLGGLSDESWGLDNVRVTDGTGTVFLDDFENGARPEWSVATTTSALNFGRFSGRFSTAMQTLTLTGLNPGQPYTLSFDVYVLDSWDGMNATLGPDRFLVLADGQTVFDEAFSNNATSTQTYAGAESVRLQIVPTITRATPLVPWGYFLGLEIQGSGFIEGASAITIGGLTVDDHYVSLFGTFQTVLVHNVVTGSSNKIYRLGNIPFTLDGPIRVTTAGGYFEVPGPDSFHVAPQTITGIEATAAEGVPLDPNIPSANTGQVITLHGVFTPTADVLIQFDAVDDSGMPGTITRRGEGRNGGYSNTVVVTVPETARSGLVRLLGSPGESYLQIVPTLRGVGPVTAGTETVLQGTGMLQGDLSLSVDGQPVASYTVQTVRSSDDFHDFPDRQFVTFTVPAGIGPGIIRAVTSGGRATLEPRVVPVSTPDLTPAGDVGDTIGAAFPAPTVINGRLTIHSDLEARPGPTGDVDVYQFNFEAGERLVFDLATSFSTEDFPAAFMLLLDSTGDALPLNYEPPETVEDRIEFTVPVAGAYFLGVYGGFGFPTGSYQLHIRRMAANATILTGTSATADRGVPAHAAIASANTGQVITLTGSGLRIDEQVVFVTSYDSGERTVVPLAVAADGGSLTVRVPYGGIAGPATGVVRLSSEAVGVLLQIVPTLDDVIARGDGFRQQGSQEIVASGRDFPATVYFGNVGFEIRPFISEIELNPPGTPFGPITITTVGGSSAALAGPDIDAVVATAESGTPARAYLPSANPGQTIRIQGRRLEAQSETRAATAIVFSTIDSLGNRHEFQVPAATADPTGTEMTVIVPNDAITGPVGVVGDPDNTAIVLQIVPVVTSVTGTGPGVVQVKGKGLIEGNTTLYDFGASIVLDGSVSRGGVDVLNVFGANNTANVSVSPGASGTLTVTTAGGTSAPVSFSGINALMGPAPGPASNALVEDESSSVPLTPDVLETFVAEAVARFKAMGVRQDRLDAVLSFTLQISDLPNNYLGQASVDTITIDRNAAGWGWFIDVTPWEDSEFALDESRHELSACTAASIDHMDLLTVVMHEVGHVLGLGHTPQAPISYDIMDGLLETGARRLLGRSILDSLS